MRLYEHEAKALLRKHGIQVPAGKLLMAPARVDVPCVVKAQVLFGNRASAGGIVLCTTQTEADGAIAKLVGKKLNGETVQQVLAEERVDIAQEYYISFCFDTETRSPMLLFSASGGSGVEQRTVHRMPLRDGLTRDAIASAVRELQADQALGSVLEALWNVFISEDCTLLEVNPMGKTSSGYVCVDARIELDDNAKPRHPEWVYASKATALGRPLTAAESEVRKAGDKDHRGTANFIEMDGDIGLLAAGGGASLTCMDALIDAGGRPANYSEFSGNPSLEKVYALARAVLSKHGLKGVWIVGAIANFSRVDTMMEGIIKALQDVNPQYPIVVRRAGPFEREGLELLRDTVEKNGWRVTLHGSETPLTTTASSMVAQAYGNTD